MTDKPSKHDASPDDKPLNQAWLILLACWILATGSALGSLFFSEVMELPPCSLCWYQRTFMFPLAIVLLVGVLRSDIKVTLYALPLAVGGWLLALYHVLLHLGVISQSMAPCQQGVSCTEVQFELFGFASIPVLSFVGFSAVLGGLILLFIKTRKIGT